MWKKLGWGILALSLSACGGSTPGSGPGPQPATEAWRLTELTVAYNPQIDQPLKIFGVLKKGLPTSGEIRVFGMGGELKDQARLQSPLVDEQHSELHCLRADCHEFELAVKFQEASLEKPVHIQLFEAASAQSHLDGGTDDPAAPVDNHRRIWREFLRDGADPARTFYARATYEQRSYGTISLNNRAASRYLVFGSPGGMGGKVSFDISLLPEGHFLTGNDVGDVQEETGGRVLVTFDGGALELQLIPPSAEWPALPARPARHPR